MKRNNNNTNINNAICLNKKDYYKIMLSISERMCKSNLFVENKKTRGEGEEIKERGRRM